MNTNRIKWLPYFLSVLSGLMLAMSMPGYNLPAFAWVGFVPLLFSIKSQTPGKAFKLGLICGLSTAVLIFHSIFPISMYFIGKISLWGIFGFFFIAFYYALWYGFSSLIYIYLVSKKRKFPSFLNILIFPSIWISFEWIHSILIKGIHWTFFFLGYSQWENPFLLQLSSIFGVFGISFIIVLCNYLLYKSIDNRVIKFASIGLLLFIVFNFAGFFMKSYRESVNGKRVKVSIIQENIDALTRWNEASGDSLANVFLSLCREASTQDPDLIVWTETAIPWTFRPDDDLIQNALKITQPTNAGHIIGTISETPHNPQNVFNSAFFFHPDGRVTDKYDKTKLISFLEAPLFDWYIFRLLKFPIFRVGLNKNLVPGKRNSLLNTPYGNAGILICNESAINSTARKATAEGADFLITMSNDSWLEKTIYLECHFVISLFRAVENGRAMIINSNRGYSASLSPTGKIENKTLSKKPQCIETEIDTKKITTIYTLFGDWLPVCCVIYCIFLLLISLKKVK